MTLMADEFRCWFIRSFIVVDFGDRTRTTGLVVVGDLDEINIGSAKGEGAEDGWFRIDDSFIPKLKEKIGVFLLFIEINGIYYISLLEIDSK